MRFGCRNNRPRNPLPLVRIREVAGHRICPPAGEFCHNPFAIPLTQLIGEALRMSIPPELDLAIRLHDAAHRPEGTKQPVIIKDRLMRSGMVD
jgi:hypothetical protein